ncbi:GapS4a family protein [Polaribacter glomeratus]|uniref:GAPS4 PD-(D/E)XK nuclease domain-containing protein n=1 Tax=Polaribacter glomeratus TaxID=102 RepID=A0A2S7WZ01_9FLAO|nr:hypothetical protein [Polaribacter glomeratus]PQJ82785.1 hypothetical protein BTO16_09430 [Polaribacter glomeratus]TXD65327.1 hypothetical protein ESX12_10910 [Polaribacter glomeratus]
MGEWSKSIGEKGEKISKFVFEEILNFNSLIENESINCVRGEKHKVAKANKTTHGLDGLVGYKTPLEDNSLDMGVISTKYSAKEYPNSPSTLFKKFLKDLAFTIECFNNSKLKNDLNQKFTEVNKTEVFGVLIWLSNKSELDFNLIDKVKNVQISPDLLFDKIILLDNRKVNFLYESIYKTKKYFHVENVDFVYHNSALNLMSIGKSSFGKIFPLNYLYSDIIILRIEYNKEVILSIFVNDDFEDSQFGQILNFAKSFDHLKTVNKVIIQYLKYDDIENKNSIKDKLINHPSYKLNQNLEVKKFPSDFRDN